MTDRTKILETYYAHEKALGGPHMVKDAIWATVVELGGISYEQVKDIVIRDQIGDGA